MNAEKKLKGKSNALFCVLSLVLLVVLLFPLYWILVTSLKTEQEIFRIPTRRSFKAAISICFSPLATA